VSVERKLSYMDMGSGTVKGEWRW